MTTSDLRRIIEEVEKLYGEVAVRVVVDDLESYQDPDCSLELTPEAKPYIGTERFLGLHVSVVINKKVRIAK